MSDETSHQTLHLNGLNGATGGYLLPDLTLEDVAKLAQGDRLDEAYFDVLKQDHQLRESEHFGVEGGEEVQLNLARAGWGIVFAHEDRDRVEPIKEALAPLLQLRQEQAGDRCKAFVREKAYRRDESTQSFLARNGKDPGTVSPEVIPYYLLIVASPEKIPYRFQYQLDTQYAVGRIHFETLDEYRNYANSVAAAETGRLSVAPRAAFFGVHNPGDPATGYSAEHLVKPLAEELKAKHAGWHIDEPVLKDAATKTRLAELLGGADTPALLFTASHGLGFPNGNARQLRHQGALVCQDWPGPLQWPKDQPLSAEEHYFSADDLGADAKLGGLIAFHFACYGAGTPQQDDFAHQAFKKRLDIAPHPFVASLPQRMLGRPNGALAVIGHVERAWTCSFLWERAGAQTATFRASLSELMDARPVGFAVEHFNHRHSALAVMLNDEREAIEYGKVLDDDGRRHLADLWTANNDARGYVIVGDPAVRLPLASG